MKAKNNGLNYNSTCRIGSNLMQPQDTRLLHRRYTTYCSNVNAQVLWSCAATLNPDWIWSSHRESAHSWFLCACFKKGKWYKFTLTEWKLITLTPRISNSNNHFYNNYNVHLYLISPKSVVMVSHKVMSRKTKPISISASFAINWSHRCPNTHSHSTSG